MDINLVKRKELPSFSFASSVDIAEYLVCDCSCNNFTFLSTQHSTKILLINTHNLSIESATVSFLEVLKVEFGPRLVFENIALCIILHKLSLCLSRCMR